MGLIVSGGSLNGREDHRQSIDIVWGLVSRRIFSV